jgi:hypothetical protein
MQIDNDLFGQILFPPLGGLIWLFLSWGWCRTVRGGGPLTTVQKRIMLFGFLFVVGMVYLMAWNDQLSAGAGLPGRLVWIPSSIAWGVILGVIAWEKYRKEASSPAISGTFDQQVLIESFARVGLLVAMIGFVLEWVFVVESEGHLWIAFFWTMACAGMIFLVRTDRRAAVLAALRLLVFLAIVGAIARPSVAAGVVVASVVITFYLTQKLWTSHPVSPPHGGIGS